MLRLRRYHLRTLFVLMGVCCLVLGVCVAYYRGVQRRWQDEAQLRQLGAFLAHDRRGRIQKIPSKLIEWLNGDPTIVPVALCSPFINDPTSDQSDERKAFSNLGDEHITLIARCQWLERIELQGSQVTPAGIKVLKACFPKATIMEPNAPRLHRFELEMMARESASAQLRTITTP